MLVATGPNKILSPSASSRLRNDFGTVFAAVKQNGFCLQYADTRLRDDFLIVLAAVSSKGCSLKYASDSA